MNTFGVILILNKHRKKLLKVFQIKIGEISSNHFYELIILHPNYIYVFFNDIWKKENGLLKKKYAHTSIIIGSEIYHVGSWRYYDCDDKYLVKFLAYS